MMQRTTSKLGFSLIEMMIAVVILGIITAQMFQVFTSQKRIYTASQRVLDVQQDTRLVLDLITFDARMAGFMIPRISGVASLDGGAGPANASDRLCISDSSYFDFPAAAGASESLDAAAQHFESGKVINATFNTVNMQTMDIDSDNAPVDFAVGRGIIISDGVNTHCARILTVTPPTQIQLAVGHEIPAGMLITPSPIRAIPAVIYEVNEATLTLTRNGLALSSGVEDLQVEYWVDNSTTPPNGVIDPGFEFPVHDLNNQGGLSPMATDAIRRIRITVVTRADTTDGGVTQEAMSKQRPAVANRLAGAADAFRRRRFTTSVLPRNLL